MKERGSSGQFDLDLSHSATEFKSIYQQRFPDALVWESWIISKNMLDFCVVMHSLCLLFTRCLMLPVCSFVGCPISLRISRKILLKMWIGAVRVAMMAPCQHLLRTAHACALSELYLVRYCPFYALWFLLHSWGGTRSWGVPWWGQRWWQSWGCLLLQNWLKCSRWSKLIYQSSPTLARSLRTKYFFFVFPELFDQRVFSF